MLPVPRLYITENMERLALAELELFAHVIIECRYVGRTDGRRLRVVLGLAIERVHIRAGKARIQAAGGLVGVILQVFLELAAVDAQVGLFPVRNRYSRVRVQFF